MQAELNHEELFNFFLVSGLQLKADEEILERVVFGRSSDAVLRVGRMCAEQRRKFQSKHEFPTISLLISNLSPFFFARCIRFRAAAVDPGYEI